MRHFTALTLSLTIAAQTAMADCSTDAMVVFDGSASMSEIGFDVQDATRIVEAREAMQEIMPQVQDFRRIGLVTYGPGGSNSCDGIAVQFLPQLRAADAMEQALDELRPNGLTPLARAVERAAASLDYTNRRAVVVLVTDGNETCGGTPCASSRHLMARARDLTVHVIGFRVSNDLFAWNNPEQSYGDDTVAKCFADQTGGIFAKTETVDELVAALQRTLGCPVIGSVDAPRRAG